MLVVEHHNIGQVLGHMTLQEYLMHFHMLVVVFVDLVEDNLVVVVVDMQQLNHVEGMVVVDHPLFHMDHHGNLHKHHTHYKKIIFSSLKKEKQI